MNIAFLDIEVNTTSNQIDSLGYLSAQSDFKTHSITEVRRCCEVEKNAFICGHNFINHDAKFLAATSFNQILQKVEIIDTLYLSMLLFTNKQTHKLNKPYKDNLIDIGNDPLIDAENTKVLFEKLNQEFDVLSENYQQLFCNLLKDNQYFSGFFAYKNKGEKSIDTYQQIENLVAIEKARYLEIEVQYPVEVAFVISYLAMGMEGVISPIILNNYPNVVTVLKQLVCNKGVADVAQFAMDEFGVDGFRKFDKNTKEATADLFVNGKVYQKEIIEQAMGSESLLAILPTGGGKTLTFQIPALIKAQQYKGLSVVISPLQALMKDQVDSFKRNNNNFKVIAISGYLSPIERQNAIIEVENGAVDMLYLAPESLRSNTIFKALKSRVIERFIIDEAHCFSSWGHDFRHDYYFIATTIKELEKSSFQPHIPVSCFTATAKPEVIKDIKKYFEEKLGIHLNEFIASVERYNLEYKVEKVENDKEKYEKLIQILSELERSEDEKNPTIIYSPQNARLCKELSEKLQDDERLHPFNLAIEPFYSKLDDDKENGKRDKNSRGKSEILADFIDDKVDIVIATTAFGMGIDKANIRTIIHYEQSDSLESYLQESGRGARDENIKAQCFVLYSKEEFNRSFNQLNRSKVDFSEIKRIIKALKKRKNDQLYLSPKEIAREIGVDIENSEVDYEVVIKTALSELEKHGIVERGRNSYKMFATSVSQSEEKQGMPYVHEVLDPKKEQAPYNKLYQSMILVMQNIIQRSKLDAIETDDLSDIVGIRRKEMFEVLYQLQKDGLLKFEDDISVFIKNSVKKEFERHFKIEQEVFEAFKACSNYESINLRALNKDDVNRVDLFKQIIQSWGFLSKIANNDFSVKFKRDFCHFECNTLDRLGQLIQARRTLSEFIITELLKKIGTNNKAKEVDFSSNSLKISYPSNTLTIESYHHTFVYLHDMLKGFELRRGRLIYYQALSIKKQEKMKERAPYKRADYKKGLERYYELKIESIHIHIAFLEKLLTESWGKTKDFVKDYFSMEYVHFKRVYKFDGAAIKRPVTEERYRQILHDLNAEQKQIFEDKNSDAMMVLAGPGSGKTKTLVHKIASLITIEGNKPDYFLMLAHSRVAVADFREKLKALIGNQVYDVQIHTFHAFAISLLGRNIGDDGDLQDVVEKATQLLESGNASMSFVNMLVIDEYQDVGGQSYEFIKAIHRQMGEGKDKRIIAVGDDDQCIKDFGKDKADIKYIQEFGAYFTSEQEGIEFSQYQLLTNYRSCTNIVDFFTQFSDVIGVRLKTKPLKVYRKSPGSVSLAYYERGSYYDNLLSNIKNNKSNDIAILARTNQEVLSIYSMLVSNGIKARYIINNHGFSLGGLLELQEFLQDWKLNKNFEKSRENSDKKYHKSTNNLLKNQVLDVFEDEYQQEIKKSQSHFIRVFEQYLSKIEFDEFKQSRVKVIVSTIHKSKGKEWSDVYLCIDEQFFKTGEQGESDKRLAYVAITRAKNNLFIHSKSPFFNRFIKPEVYNVNDKKLETIVLLSGLSDIKLSANYSKQGIIKTLPMAGEEVQIVENENYISVMKDNNQISSLSISMVNKIKQQQNNGYILQKAEIENVVVWRDKKSDETFNQVLCKIYLTQAL
ncbi:MAG: ATP-dependent DNA helicase Rep [Catillopecten margaritatus gill symbiont]|uniref:DNA 3'-5' helicase n=1 Tax=Catillopecten margaritatus gill symbiont TaxID=3083288 RepID=A0AAU6PIH4_9GAMM